MSAAFMRRAILDESKICNMPNNLCWDSATYSRGIWSVSEILLNSSWKCLKWSPVVGGGGVMASSGEEEVLVVGMAS